MAKTDENPEAAGNVGGEVGGESAVGGSTPNPPQQASVQQGDVNKEASKDARMWAMFCHLAGLAGLLPIVPIVGGVIGPLIIWQIKKDDFPFVDEQGKEAVNFQISILIYEVVSIILCLACIGAFLLPAVVIFDIVFLLIAAVKANDGRHYRYPLTIRFIK